MNNREPISKGTVEFLFVIAIIVILVGSAIGIAFAQPETNEVKNPTEMNTQVNQDLENARIAEIKKEEKERKAKLEAKRKAKLEKKRKAEAERKAKLEAQQEREAEEEQRQSEVSHYSGDFKSEGEVYYNGYRFTWYSENVLPGGGLTKLNNNGRHVDSQGFIRDGDGYIACASNDFSEGTTIDTPFGTGKIYDCGCDSGTVDVYVSW